MPIFKKAKQKDVPLPEPESAVKQLDKRVGYDSYRDFYTLKNYWKTVDRNKKFAAGLFMDRYLKARPENQAKYAKLKNLTNITPESADPGFEAVSAQYLKVFDDVITTVEEQPSDASPACDRLIAVGKMHRTKVSGMKFDDFQQLEDPFLYMIGEILQDRFNEKAENLFRKFFQFCLKYILEGFNS
uniref:Globin family profile domain-containing protein n=1 Tax=Acrobeloides nanus TaxID=290746 RepID=A0A914C722_9BILA